MDNFKKKKKKKKNMTVDSHVRRLAKGNAVIKLIRKEYEKIPKKTSCPSVH
jgi:endonuclease III